MHKHKIRKVEIMKMKIERRNKNVGNGYMSAQRGITLIALVVTIIVLIILAGITLSLTIGQDGIINKAKQAGKTYKNAEANELAELDKLYSQISIAGNSQVTLNKEQLDEYINKKVEEKVSDMKNIIEEQNMKVSSRNICWNWNIWQFQYEFYFFYESSSNCFFNAY